jgi:hypothetical protein
MQLITPRLDRKTFEEAAEYFCVPIDDYEDFLATPKKFAEANPHVPWLVAYANAELRVGAPLNLKWLLVGPTQTVQTLEQAASIQLDKELASTTIWPMFYVENPWYKGSDND